MKAAMIGEDGGVLVLGEATLVIPPGALDQPVLITARSRPGDDTEEVEYFSPVFELGPDGLEFAVPATLIIALSEPTNGDEQLVVAQITDSGFEPLTTIATEAGLTASLAHFSWYAILSLIPQYECAQACGGYQACCPLDDEANACVPIDTPTHCGGCSSCTAPEICCAEFTADPHTFKCVDVKANDAKNCGACGVDCAQSSLGGPACCGGLCVDFQTDPRHCGRCDHACDAGSECEAGKCVPNCTPCVGYDGTEDCCPVGTTCHTEPIKGGPCL